MGALIGMSVAEVGAAGEAAPPLKPHRLVTTSREIESFAQDRGYLAWTTREGRCGSRLRIRRAGKTVTIDGVACPDNPDEGQHVGELAVANGRVLWSVWRYFGSHDWVNVDFRTATFTDRRIRTLAAMQVLQRDGWDEPMSLPMAGTGALLVYYSDRHEESGLRENAIRRVVGTRTRKLFDLRWPVDLAVQRDRVGLVQRELRRGEQCCNFRPVWSRDGRKIAFLHGDGPGYDPGGWAEELPNMEAELAVINADGTGFSVLTSDRLPRNGVDWSNDGTKLVNSYQKGSSQALAGRQRGRRRRARPRLGREPLRSEMVAYRTRDRFSGRPISCHRQRGRHGASYLDPRPRSKLVAGRDDDRIRPGQRRSVRDAEGRHRHPPSHARRQRRVSEVVARRSQDRLRKPRLCGRAFTGGLYAINVDGSGRQRLTKNWRDSAPEWSPDGRRLVFWSTRDDLHSGETVDGELYLLDP